jgi:hypothetical protein
MRKTQCALVAVLVFCGALVLGPAPKAMAAADCTTQGDLALGLASRVDNGITTTDAAIAALLAINVQPDLGWKPGECLTPEVRDQVLASYKAAAAERNLDPGAGQSVLDALGMSDRQLQDVSPH